MRNKTSYILLSVSFVVVIFSALSCNKSTIYSNALSIKNDKWSQDDTLFFTFHSEDTLSLYDVYMNIRNTSDYSYKNLFMFVTTYYPAYTFSRDTTECILADDAGKWLGKGIGKHKDNLFLFKKNVRLRYNGTYTIAVNQAMRIEDLNGISNIGFIIKKSEHK